MKVLKRDGITTEEMSFDKIVTRISKKSSSLSGVIDPHKLAIKVMDSLYDEVPSSEIDKELAQSAAALATVHPDYGQLAANIAISNMHKNTKSSFRETMKELYFYINPKTGRHNPIISQDLWEQTLVYHNELEEIIDYNYDYSYDYFAYATLEKGYLLKVNNKVVERPQHMLMRVALGIHGRDLEKVGRTYKMMRDKKMTHATPTLFNAGTPKPQLASCFLLQTQDDSIEGIYDTLKQTAVISQAAGGIGLSIHDVRATGSYISGTNGTSNGIVPMLRVFNDTARYVDQGGGKRKGSFAIYIEPWHADIFDFLDLKKNHGKEEMRARDLFYAMWINDLFMERVKADSIWSLMDPNQSPGLSELHSQEFNDKYLTYEKEGKYVVQIKARELWEKIIESQIETGTPYMLYKDAANSKSNQQNLGTIKSSNLCAEIMEYTSKDEIAVCNLASIALPKFVKEVEGKKFVNHAALHKVAYDTTINLNDVIDKNSYPLEEARYSNKKHRPIGLGVQGLAELFFELRLPFESEEAKRINFEVHETIYYAALDASAKLCEILPAYDSFELSPIQQGKFQFDLWGLDYEKLSGRYDWEELRKRIQHTGVRNSLVTALMPTASTGQILGNTECFEPITSNVYTRRTLAGEFIIINKYLVKDLIKLDLWDDDMRQMLIAHNGSVQQLPIPHELKELYKTVWEMSMKNIIDMSADRGNFIDQSQSLNLFLEQADYSKLTSMHFYAWEKGLKTGMYYLRTKAAVNAIKFTIDKDKLEAMKAKAEGLETKEEAVSVADFRARIEASRKAAEGEDDDDCLMCGS
jgi:ribonucleoside-diphosphate reductase alpha chain